MIRRILSFFLAAVIVSVSFAGCGSASESSGSTGGGNSTWTVMLYLCGTDLESSDGSASANLEEIFTADLSDNINFVIQTGGTKNWQTNGIDSDKLQRFVVEDGALSLVEEQELASMGEADTLGSFLKWGAENYPADKYMVSFWNHGGGSVSGVEFDELYDDDSLTLTELADGISQAGVSFELIGFDTCLMATLENAVLISPYCDYMVASEEYEPGGGWNYTEWLNYLSSNSDCSGEELGRMICDSYYEKCTESGDESMATLSVTDLSKIDALQTAFVSMSEEMTTVASDITSFQKFTKGAVKAENYGGNTDEEGYTNLVDLGDLVANTSDILGETADNVTSALSDAVVYQVKGENRSNANGLSVFYPISADSETCSSYAAVTDNTAYLSFISTVCGSWDASEYISGSNASETESVSADDYKIEINQRLNDDGYFVMNITSGLEAVETVRFSLYYADEESGEYILLGLDNDIDSDWDNGVFTDNFRGVWLTIGDAYAAPELIAETDEYNIYSIPVLLNGEETNLRVTYNYDSESFEILGAYDGVDSETGMSSRDIKKLKDGDSIVFLFTSYNVETDKETVYEMGEIAYSDDTEITESELFDGEYLYQYEVTDVFGNTVYSDFVIMECDNGEIYASETE